MKDIINLQTHYSPLTSCLCLSVVSCHVTMFRPNSQSDSSERGQKQTRDYVARLGSFPPSFAPTSM